MSAVTIRALKGPDAKAATDLIDHYLSGFTRLSPGDVIATGTPAASASSASRSFMKSATRSR